MITSNTMGSTLRSETEMVRPCGEEDRRRDSKGIMGTRNMEVSGHRNIERPKLRWSDVVRKNMKERSTERITTPDEESATGMSRLQIWKRPKKTLSDD